MAYNRDETVAAITSFYEFLTKVHLDESDILRPPPGENGWSHLTDDRLSMLGKNHVVNDLIRHLPYIKSDSDVAIYYKTSGLDFAGQFPTSRNPAGFESQSRMGLCTVPPHVLTLAESRGRDGYYFMLDTERGTVTKCDFMYGRMPTELSEVNFFFFFFFF